MHASGEIGALLRQEGIYSSHLAQWRKQRVRGVLFGSSQAAKYLRALDEENRRLRQELKTTKSQLVKAETIIDVQNSLCAAWRQRPDRVRAKKMQMVTTLSAAMSVIEAPASIRSSHVPRTTGVGHPRRRRQKKPVATDDGSRMNGGDHNPGGP